MNTNGPGISGYLFLLAIQIIILISYAIFVRYDNNLLPSNGTIDDGGHENVIDDDEDENHVPSYPRKCDGLIG